jgi:hypothetical protein
MAAGITGGTATIVTGEPSANGKRRGRHIEAASFQSRTLALVLISGQNT